MNHTTQKIKHESPLALGREAPLGITAKSSSPCGGDLRKKARAVRAQRFQALSEARHVLARVAAPLCADGSRYMGDIYRTIDCRHSRRADFVGVHYSAQFQAAHYGNLATCGSVWACPVCCAKIQERRRPEIAQLMEWAHGHRLRPVMVTFTFPHTRFDSLADLLSKQREAFRLLRSGKAWQSFKQSFGFTGLVRSLELTHGRNGWHPHTHELWLLSDLELSQRAPFLDFVRDRWFSVCEKVGLVSADQAKHFLAHAVGIRWSVSSSDYLAKQDSSRAWGVDSELARSSSKKGKASGVHPHEFLIRRAPGDAELYLEYVNAMKGQRQLFWSHGLKSAAGVTDVSDEEHAKAETEKADCLGLLTPDAWRVVRGSDARAELLDAAELGGWPAVLALLASLGCQLSPYELHQLE